MGLPRDYNKALHRHANFHAAWFPITVPHRIGDYGLIQNGVFQKIGHLDQLKDDGFDVPIETREGNPTTLDFLSEGAKMVRVVAGVEVPELPVANVNASVKFKFEKENSFVLKAAEIKVEQMDNIDQVARKLAVLRREKKWSHRNKVVSATYTGQQCLVLLSSERGTEVGFEGEASALKQLEMGKITLKPQVTFSSDTILRSIGDTGVIGIGLFKLRMLNSAINILTTGELTKEELAIDDSLGEDPQDDI